MHILKFDGLLYRFTDFLVVLKLLLHFSRDTLESAVVFQLLRMHKGKLKPLSIRD